MSEKIRKKAYHECSRRHQRRIVQENRNYLLKDCMKKNEFVDKENVATQEQPKHDQQPTDSLSDSSWDYMTLADNSFETEVLIDQNSIDHSYVCSGEDFSENNCESKFSLLNDDITEDASDDDHISNKTNENFRDDFTDLVLSANLTHKTINDMLCLLLRYFPSIQLPRDARALLKTPRKINIDHIGGGEYVNFGLKRILEYVANNYFETKTPCNGINLTLNVDGIPIAKSSSKCLWPILIMDNHSKAIHMFGAFFGISKPSSANEYLKPFIDEYLALCVNGFVFNSEVFDVSIKFVCDAPAKSFILSTKGHTGFSSCSKCTVIGKYVNNTVCFPFTIDNNDILRTDESFVQQLDDKYHQGGSILASIPNINLVSDVPLDYMHLICLGVMRKLMMLWIKGPLKTRIGGTACNILSKNLLDLRHSTPKEFARKPRGIAEIKNWKATEFRQILLYTGPIVLKSVLPLQIYEHFLSLHVAISILVNPEHIKDETNLIYVEELLIHFIKCFQILYGEQFISHNVHNLLHLTNDVRKHGCLDNFSAFPFENFLGSLKKYIRKPEKPLQQLALRYTEHEFNTLNKNRNLETGLKYNHFCGPIIPSKLIREYKQFKIFQNNNIYINCDNHNNIVLLNNFNIVRVVNIIENKGNEVFILAEICRKVGYMYEKPCNSSLFNIYLVTGSRKLDYWPIENIVNKMYVIPKSANEFYVIPFNHEYQ